MRESFSEISKNAKTYVVKSDIFKIELIDQLVRRMNTQKAIKLYEFFIERIEIGDTSKIKGSSTIAYAVFAVLMNEKAFKTTLTNTYNADRCLKYLGGYRNEFKNRK